MFPRRIVALTCGLLASAVRINSGPSWAMSLAWRVEGKATFVATLTPGDGPRSPAGQRATGVPPKACGTVAEHCCPSPVGLALGLDAAKKLLS